jgi:serine/threonine protein kinase
MSKILRGTPCYIAPEVFSEEGYSYKADVFSAGSLLYSLQAKRTIFKKPISNNEIIRMT